MKSIAIGCSNTFGEGLLDCDTFNRIASKNTWANCLANKLNLNSTLVNLSLPGASNDYICRTILNYYHSNIEYVFIMWSYESRFEIYLDNTWQPLGNWLMKDNHVYHYKKETIESVRQYYTDLYSDELGRMNLVKNVSTLVNFLDSKNAKYFMTFSNYEDKPNLEKQLLHCGVNKNICFDRFDKFVWNQTYDYFGTDGSHYNERAHKDWADHLFQCTNIDSHKF